MAIFPRNVQNENSANLETIAVQTIEVDLIQTFEGEGGAGKMDLEARSKRPHGVRVVATISTTTIAARLLA